VSSDLVLLVLRAQVTALPEAARTVGSSIALLRPGVRFPAPPPHGRADRDRCRPPRVRRSSSFHGLQPRGNPAIVGGRIRLEPHGEPVGGVAPLVPWASMAVAAERRRSWKPRPSRPARWRLCQRTGDATTGRQNDAYGGRPTVATGPTIPAGGRCRVILPSFRRAVERLCARVERQCHLEPHAHSLGVVREQQLIGTRCDPDTTVARPKHLPIWTRFFVPSHLP
jgi:hypothetical protein